MSVILFHSSEVYTELAKAYESLKPYRLYEVEVKSDAFYGALRRLYFANVAAFLCNYHDETELDQETLASIETFSDFGPVQGDSDKDLHELVYDFCSAWGSLEYNLYTNGGELYKPQESYELLSKMANSYMKASIRCLNEQMS